MKAPDDETKEEREAGVHVRPELDFHDKGCVKRYGAVPDAAEKCLCEKRRDASIVNSANEGRS